MLPITSYEMVRRMQEERRERSLRRFWWRYREPELEPPVSPWIREAEVIELVFGARCETEEQLGA